MDEATKQTAEEIVRQFANAGMDVCIDRVIPHLPNNGDWVTIATHRPGDLNDSPWLVICSVDDQPGAVTQTLYVPLS